MSDDVTMCILYQWSQVEILNSLEHSGLKHSEHLMIAAVWY
jgi:hypothetical protein